MADRLTQLQDAVDQLAHQFVASLWFVHKHHDLQTLSATDKIHEEKKDTDLPDNEKLETYAEADFKAGQLELAQDLIRKEQLIEGLICLLPGVNNSEKDQEQMIQLLEQELQEAEARRQEALKEKDIVLAKLENVIRSIRRP